MKFSTLAIILLTLLSTALWAQKPSKVLIKGALQDTSHQPVPFGVVMLLNPADSSLQNFTTANEKGQFSFPNMKNTSYILKASHISMLPLQMLLKPSTVDVNEVAVIMKPLSHSLLEVVIKAAKAPLHIRGDTIEYDASTFKVPAGSTVEDLLRRLPGIDVDADGNISTQGEDVKRMYVDGKTFFGDDPKSVTKNIGAEAISKVQVYNEKSEQTKLTGIDDGNKDKAMNLELKQEFKKGSFGKATLAGGTEERWAARGSYNRFSDKEQLSFLAYANNINQTGVNWEDYGEFRGSNSFNDFDNGDFGFSNGGGRRFSIGGDDFPLNYYDGRGLTKNFGAGTNYNYDNKKTRFNSSYFYNQTHLDLTQQSTRKTLLEGSSFNSADTVSQTDFRGSHSIGTRFEHEFDSSNRVIMKANFRYSNNDNTNLQNQFFYDVDSQPFNNLNIDNQSNLDAVKITSAVIYRHLFHRTGRSIAVSGGFNYTFNDSDEDLFSLNKFFAATTPTAQIQQLNKITKDITQAKANALYTEPLSKRWFWQSFYNFSNTITQSNKQATDPTLHVASRIDSLSVFFNNTVAYNRLGTGIQYSYNGLNGSIGIAAQQLLMTGKYALDKEMPWLQAPLKKTYNNLTPNLQFSYEMQNHMRTELSYQYEISEPSFSDLQPVQTATNPAYRVQGNPDLEPQRMHSISAGFNYWNPASFSNLFFNATYRINENPIVYNQTISFFENVGMVTVSKPANLTGGNSFNASVWTSQPIVKTKLTVDVNLSHNRSNAPALVNNVKNTTHSEGYNFNSNFNFTPGSKLIMTLGGSGNLTNITYSIRKEQNQKIRNYSASASVKWQFIKNTFFESNFNYSKYKNESFGFNRDIPTWNASLRRILGKKSRFELRLAAFDILNKNLNISQYATQNYIVRTESNTLSRYYMLSLTFNVRGFENKLQNQRRMFM